jgi:hypothetical protein
MIKYRHWLFLACLFPWFAGAQAATHALLISACPAWKDGGDPETTQAMRASCRGTIDVLQEALQHHLRIPKESQVVLLDEAANYAKVVETITTLKRRLKPKDRLLVYVNVHGGRLQGRYAGITIADEGLALWTDKEPNLATAADDRKFMLVKTFRDLLLDGLNANDVLVIFDSCESGAAYEDFRYNPYANDDLRVAVVFSSQADQFANYTYDLKYPLFTHKLMHALSLSAYRGFDYAVELAATATHRTQRARCAVPEVRLAIKKADIDLREVCLQQPYIYDPEALLQDWLITPNEE